MSSPRTFDLLSLPLVILETVLSKLDFTELFTLSLCSKRAQQILKFARNNLKRKDFTVYFTAEGVRYEIVLENFGEIAIEKRDENLIFKTSFFELDRPSEKRVISALDLKHVWKSNNKSLEARELVEYIRDIFKIDSPWFFLAGDLSNVKEIVRDAPPTSRFSCELDPMSDGDYSYVLQHAHTTCLAISQSDEGCEDLDLDMKKSKIKYFRSNHTRWMRLRHMLDWDFIEMKLEDVSIKDTEVNTFLKCWKNGQKTNMRHLTIASRRRRFYEDKVLDGLSAEKMNDEDVKLFHCELFFHNSKVESIKGGYEICSIDGGVCRIFLGRRELKFYFWSSN